MWYSNIPIGRALTAYALLQFIAEGTSPMLSDSNLMDLTVLDRNKLETLVHNLLFTVSFKTSLAGCGYLSEALVEYCLSNSVHKTLSNDVYPILSSKHNVKQSSIDRDISTAIRNCFNYGNMRKLNEIFNCRLIDERYPPTNLEFIANVSTRLKYAVQSGEADTLFSQKER